MGPWVLAWIGFPRGWESIDEAVWVSVAKVWSDLGVLLSGERPVEVKCTPAEL
jgi:hypothetical protein